MDKYLRGIDVSNHQGNFDWSRVAKSDVHFAFVKATEGGTYQDKFFERNVGGAREHGIAVGAYHFFRPKGPVEKQIENFLTVAGAVATDLPPVVDLEVPGDWAQFGLIERVGKVQTYLDAVEREFKRRPIIYMNPSFGKEILLGSDALSDYKLWIAHYTKADAPLVPPAWKDWTFWQYSDSGTVSGISGNVDMNYYNGDAASMSELLI